MLRFPRMGSAIDHFRHRTFDLMHSATFLQDLAAVLLVAGLVTVLFRRLRQPVVLGYIAAGVIIGPHTQPFPLIRDEATIHTLAELGVLLLMFSLGLEFSLKKLRQVGRTAFITASVIVLTMGWVGYEVGQLFAWSPMDSLFLGAMLSVSSTTIIVKALAELGKSKEPFAQLIFGVLIIEDILAIAMIALLSGIATTGGLSVGEVGRTLGRLSLFLVATLVVGLLVVPRFLSYVARFRSQETLLITVLGLCFGVSLLAVKLGYSVALGAFLIGAVIAESREIHRIEALVEPVRDMFSAVFFVAIGLMIDPALLAQYWQPIAVISGAVMVGQIASCTFGTFLSGHDTRTSLRVGMGLAQIGEFSFIIAALGQNLGVTSKFLYPIAVAVSALTTLATPYLLRGSDSVASGFERLAPRWLTDTLQVYTDWVGRLGRRNPDRVSRFVRKWSLQMLLNAALIAVVFVVVSFVAARWPAGPLPGVPEPWMRSAYWLAAVVLSLPMILATFGKLRALGLLLAETKVTQRSAGVRAPAIRAIVAQVIPIGGSAILGLYVLVLSSTLLTSWRALAVLATMAAILTWVLRRTFVRLYSRAQNALSDTLAGAAEAHGTAPAPAPELPALLRDAHLQTLPVGPGSPAAGRRLRELQLRTLTGASVVGIDREGASLVNPGADEELREGDRLLLLGSPRQLDSARGLILPAPGETAPEPA
jgi:CPA2 family monovalent cation:H+ antiporter-2